MGLIWGILWPILGILGLRYVLKIDWVGRWLGWQVDGYLGGWEGGG